LKLVEEIKARKLMDRIVVEGGAEGLQAFFAWELSSTQTNTQSETWAHVAARLGKADVLATAAASGVTLDAVDAFGYTPLLRAVRENHLDCVQFLIGKVDLNVKLKWTLTPVQMALEEKKAPIALALIQQPSVELTGVTVKNETLLHLVMMQKDLPLLKAFLEHNQDQAQALNREGACPLTVGIEEGSFECVQYLASAMKSVDVPSPKGVTPLMVAAGKGKAAVVKFLLSKGANPKAMDQEGMAAVHYAARGGSVEVLELFSDFIQLARKDGRQPLHLAASQGMLAAAAHLLDKKAPFLACDERGWTAAHVAAAFGKWEILALFKARGLNIDISDNPAKETPLMIALEAAQFTCVRWLKTEGASFEAVDQRGWNPLQRCILGHQLQAVCFLFDEIKLDPAEISPTKKVAPLHLAASSGAEALVQELLRRKVPVDPLDRNGKTPLILAIQSGHGACTRHLVAAGANVAFEMKDGYTTLHYASDPSLVEYILSLHPELVSKRTKEEGHTPLHRVMYQSHEHLGEVIRLLIRYGADVNAPDNYQYVALHLAAKNGQDQIVKILLELGARTDLRNANGRTPAEHASYMAEKASDELRARILTTKALIEEHEKGSKKSLGKGTGLFGSLKDRRKKEITFKLTKAIASKR
jgi:ankyrin